MVIPEVSSNLIHLYLKINFYWSVGISISHGLIANEFITIFTPGRGVFGWNDILWTIIGACLFTLIHMEVQAKQHRSLMKERHIEFLIRFHKPTSRQLNLLSDGMNASLSAEINPKIFVEDDR